MGVSGAGAEPLGGKLGLKLSAINVLAVTFLRITSGTADLVLLALPSGSKRMMVSDADCSITRKPVANGLLPS